MDVHKKENKCCLYDYNLIELDGTNVCSKCGKVQDEICFGKDSNTNSCIVINPDITEFCHRLHIDRSTQIIANDLYNNTLSHYPSLRRRIILATSIYIATKKNTAPRTLKEIGVATGISANKIGEYERIICQTYYPTNAIQYLDRFGTQLNLTYRELRQIEKEIRVSFYRTEIQNPILLCATYLYMYMSEFPSSLCKLHDTTGIPVSTLKSAYKREFNAKGKEYINLGIRSNLLK